MTFSDDFSILQQKVFEPCGLTVSQPIPEDESAEYHAHRFSLNRLSVVYRLAKVTPTKVGQFVTLWKRETGSEIEPLASSDDVDFVIVTVKTRTRFGLFVFPKSALIKHGVFSVNGNGGKRALRVYPAWDKTESKQAQKTQAWQLDYFAEFRNRESVNIQRLRYIFSV